MTEPQAETITHHPSELLRQVAMYMNGRDTDISVTVPVRTTWKTALHTTDLALGNLDGPMTVLRLRTEAQQRRLREMALENVAAWNSSSSSQQVSPGRLIRTKYDISSLPMPKPASKETLQRLKENTPFDDFREPYPIAITAAITENRLPIIRANITLQAIDHSSIPKVEELNLVEMLWDTGAHQTIITEELLSESFREFLRQPSHDIYRSEDKLRVQLDAVIAFTNTPTKITAIALVVPKSVIPNQRIGVIFGQQQCIDCLSYRSIPRRILKAKGEDIDDEVWGDIVLDEYINEDDDLVSL